jgi:hypothetical protein
MLGDADTQLSYRNKYSVPIQSIPLIYLTTAFFGVITQRVVVIPYGRLSRPEMSVQNYHYSLRNNPEERRFHLLRSGSLKSRIFVYLFVCLSVCPILNDTINNSRLYKVE